MAVQTEGERDQLVAERQLQLMRRSTLSYCYSAAQLSQALEQLPPRLVWARVEAFLALVGRVLDPERLALPKFFTWDEVQELRSRLGHLNVLNPFLPDGRYLLDLRRHDERATAAALLRLAVEPGGNVLDVACGEAAVRPGASEFTRATRMRPGV